MTGKYKGVNTKCVGIALHPVILKKVDAHVKKTRKNFPRYYRADLINNVLALYFGVTIKRSAAKSVKNTKKKSQC